MGKLKTSDRYPCPSCNASKAVQQFEDGKYHCFSCKKQLTSLDKSILAAPIVKAKSCIAKVSEIPELPTRGFQERKIKKPIAEFYKVKVSYNSEGAIAVHYYPYEGGKRYKVRVLPKDFSWLAVGVDKGSLDLFGVEHFTTGGRRVIITEGELDALTLAQASYDRYGTFYPIISLSSSSSLQGLISRREWLRSFEEVVLAYDMDDAGNEAVEKSIAIIGLDKVKIAKFPKNDPSATYLAEGGDALLKCILNAGTYIPLGVLRRDEIWTKLCTAETIPGIPYPECFRGVSGKLKKMREGEITVLVSGTGCHAKGSLILMGDGLTKKVEDIRLNDTVMGEEGLGVKVVDLHRGEETMIRVDFSDGGSMVVNKNHIFACVSSRDMFGYPLGAIVEIKAKQVMQLTSSIRRNLRMFRSGPLRFGKKTLELNSYLLGFWLGLNRPNYVLLPRGRGMGNVRGLAERLGYETKIVSKSEWVISEDFYASLRSLGIFERPHIPVNFKTSSMVDRKRLLAGLVDGGCRFSVTHNRFEFYTINRDLQNDVIFLCRSLGYEATTLSGVVRFRGKGFHQLPQLLRHKHAERFKNNRRDWLSFDLTVLPSDDYYGFTLDSESGRFIMGDFLVTHNSGKTTAAREIMLHAIDTTKDKIGIVELEASPQETARSLAYMALRHNPVNGEFSTEALKPGFDKVFGEDRVLVLDHQGSLEKSIIEKLEYMALMGCKWIFLDHITLLVSEGMGHLQGNEAQDRMMNELSRLVKKYPIWIGLISQLRKTTGDAKKSFEEGAMPSLDDIKGSGSIKQIAFDIIGFARNMNAEEQDVRNRVSMRVLKARTTGLTGPVEGVIYDFNTGRLKPADGEDLLESEAPKLIASEEPKLIDTKSLKEEY